jgi:cob(I)alamin adenosyltransferase
MFLLTTKGYDMDISSISPVSYYSNNNNTQNIAQLQKQILTLQKQIDTEDQSKTDAAADKQKKVLLLQQQIQQIQAQIQQLTNSTIKSV